jgi:hypothetical protein
VWDGCAQVMLTILCKQELRRYLLQPALLTTLHDALSTFWTGPAPVRLE